MSGWHAIVLGGDERDVRAFVARFAVGRPADSDERIVVGSDVGLVRDSHADRLEPGRHAVLVDDGLMVAFVDAVAGAAGAGLRLVEWRAVERASFGFEAEATSREAAAAIRDALRPFGGVRLAEHAEHEEEQVHDGRRRYIFRIRGRIEGTLLSVIAFQRRLAAGGTITTSGLQIV